MRICYFGTYEKSYPRNSVAIEGLRKNGAKVIECHSTLWESKEDKARLSAFGKALLIARLPFAYLSLAVKYLLCRKGGFDAMIVGYIGQTDMFLARMLAPRTTIIFNPMISLHDTLVNDRALVKNAFAARALHLLDSISCKLADLVVLDTEAHADYFRKEFGIKKVDVLPVGAEDSFLKAAAIWKDEGQSMQMQKKKVTKVLYYGKYTPLHGTRHVIEAAKLLERYPNIRLEIIGTGQTYSEDMKRAEQLKLKNTLFTDWVAYTSLPRKIADSDICLGGHFGTGEKALRVVPNKVFQMIALGKPVVVNDGATLKEEGFIDGINCITCPAGSPKAIAEAVLRLDNDAALRGSIGNGAKALFSKKYSSAAIGRSLLKQINTLKKRR
ncbi:MAG TPA: glycosyltransferase [Candidatus Nanoarchaeia archaeon]|nr:hypothetical protein [uncultured archaeon]HLC46533.1 glycosyltransferase [Candidatus Nanoarchaeia archaeon]